MTKTLSAIGQTYPTHAGALGEWVSESTAPQGEVVWTKIDDRNGVRNVTMLVKEGNLWFVPDRSVYVYYTPTHWRRA